MREAQIHNRERTCWDLSWMSRRKARTKKKKVVVNRCPGRRMAAFRADPSWVRMHLTVVTVPAGPNLKWDLSDTWDLWAGTPYVP